MTVLSTHSIDFHILDRPDTPTRNYAKGDKIITEGGPATEMYLLRKGRVEISVHGKTVEEVHAGGIFGEMALIDQSSRTASATALEDCQVVPIDQRLFVILVQDVPYFAIDVMRVLVERLRAMDRKV